MEFLKVDCKEAALPSSTWENLSGRVSASFENEWTAYVAHQPCLDFMSTMVVQWIATEVSSIQRNFSLPCRFRQTEA